MSSFSRINSSPATAFSPTDDMDIDTEVDQSKVSLAKIQSSPASALLGKRSSSGENTDNRQPYNTSKIMKNDNADIFLERQLSTLQEKITNTIVSYNQVSPLSGEYRKLRKLSEDLQLEYKSKFYNIPLSNLKELSAKKEPAELSKAIQAAQAQVKNITRNANIDLILANSSMTRPQVMALSETQFEIKLQACETEAKLHSDTNDLFRDFLATTGVPHYKMALHRDRNQNFKLDINRNASLGYAAFTVLHSNKILPQDAVYNMEHEFTINKDQLQVLHDYLKQTKDWKKDVKSLFSEIISLAYGRPATDEELDKIVQIAQKPISELFKSNSRLSQRAEIYFKRNINNTKDPIILFNSLGLDLKTVPGRENLKQQIEKIYAATGLTDSTKVKVKEFMQDDKWRTNLAVGQVKTVSPSLHELVAAIKLSKEQGGNNDPLRIMGEYRVQTMKQMCYKLNAAKIPTSNIYAALDHERDNNGRRITEPLLERVFLNARNFTKLQHESIHMVDKLLRFLMETSPPNIPPSAPLTQNHLNKLYTKGWQNITAGSPQLTAKLTYNDPSTPVDLLKFQHHQLVSQLKSLPVYKNELKSSPHLATVVDNLDAEFNSRIGRETDSSMEKGPFGKEVIREALKNLEEIVAKLKNHTELHISSESIAMAFVELGSQIGDRKGDYCSDGFAGRLQVPLSLLTPSSEDIVEAKLQDIMKGQIRVAWQEVNYGNSENSMGASRQMEALQKKYNLSSEVQSGVTSKSQSSGYISEKFETAFKEKCHPGLVFEHMYDFLRKKIWDLAQNGDDTGVCEILTKLGYESEFKDKHRRFSEFRVNGEAGAPWNCARINQLLVYRVIDKLNDLQAMKPETTGIQRTGNRKDLDTNKTTSESTQQKLGQSSYKSEYIPPAESSGD